MFIPKIKWNKNKEGQIQRFSLATCTLDVYKSQQKLRNDIVTVIGNLPDWVQRKNLTAVITPYVSNCSKINIFKTTLMGQRNI